MVTNAQINQQLDLLFRREAGRIVAILTKAFGASQIDLAEIVVQEALLKATQVWLLTGIPENPAAWIMQVAKNKALDTIRRERHLVVNLNVIESMPEFNEDFQRLQAFELEIQDDQLRLMFICCHPILSYEMQLALTLKTVCGFGVSEISRAFFAKNETIAQRLVRAKQKIREAKLRFELPETQELKNRVDAVLDVIYFLFNEGYSSQKDDKHIREDVCLEACRLVRLLTTHDVGSLPKAYALAAFMLLQTSRLNARVDLNGEVLLLQDQDRSKWDHNLIREGLCYLEKAATGPELTQFHLMAGIAACHATAGSFHETDWSRILDYYDDLSQIDNSPVIALNRSVVVSFTDGPQNALMEIQKLRDIPAMKKCYLLPATSADFYRRLGDSKRAMKCYQEALDLVGTGPERRFLKRRIAEL